jgi:flagellar basal-body rod protein FlgG
MQNVLAIALTSMHQDSSRLDHVALNLANVATPGYKREVVAARAFAEALDAAGLSQALDAESEPNSRAAAGSLQVLTDLRPGTMKITGQPLDLAVGSEGYFEVTTPHGLAYTRQGNFHLDGQGRLVTAQGHPVVGKHGEIRLTTPTPVIDAVGNITEPNATTGPSAMAPGEPVAQIRVVRMDDPRSARRLGEGLLAAGSPVTEVGEGEAQLRQGALENANVSSMLEMVQLIQTMRHFESMQKVAQGYDEMLGAAIRRLGDL